MSWADKAIANPQGYERAVLFPRARDALAAYRVISARTPLPICVCPEIAVLATEFLDVDDCGMAYGTQLYGYRLEHEEDLDLDPLMTGWFLGATNSHRIVSFGANKILPLTGGGAFLTCDAHLAGEMEKVGGDFFPGGNSYIGTVEDALAAMDRTVYNRRSMIKLWDRYLGDMLGRIPREQIMPWRVMRLAPQAKRAGLIAALRHAAIAVSTNYPMIGTEDECLYPGGMAWESTVINFPLILDGIPPAPKECDSYESYVERAATIIYQALK